MSSLMKMEEHIKKRKLRLNLIKKKKKLKKIAKRYREPTLCLIE